MRVTVKFSLKKTKSRADGKCPVYVRCTMNNYIQLQQQHKNTIPSEKKVSLIKSPNGVSYRILFILIIEFYASKINE